MGRCFKCRQSSDKISLKNFIFNTVVDIHLAFLLKNVTHPLQVFYKEINKTFRAPIVGQPLNGCFFPKVQKIGIKNSPVSHKHLGLYEIGVHFFEKIKVIVTKGNCANNFQYRLNFSKKRLKSKLLSGK